MASDESARRVLAVHEPSADHPGWMTWTVNDPGIYNALFQPMLVRTESATVARVRLTRLERRHSNFSGSLHGGTMLGLIDVALFVTIQQLGVGTAENAVTVDLNTQMVAAGRLDCPLDALCEVVRTTKSLIFQRGLLVQGEGDAHVVASFAAVVKKTRPPA